MERETRGKTETALRNERLRQLAEELRRVEPAPCDAANGRGIVVVAGGARIFTNAYVLLHILRRQLASRLPIEVWFFGQSEISPSMAALLEPFNVRLVDALPLIHKTGATIRDGWQLKSFALFHSRFAEVLLLDADQVPICDPTGVFDWPEYQRSGAVFWPDIVDLQANNQIWEIMGLPARRTISLESGQLLVDRRRHLRSLQAAVRLNEMADDLYELIYGDKDSYLLAWTLTDGVFALVPHRPFVDEMFLVQRDFAGNPLFQHLTNAKWQYGAEQRRLPGLVHLNACLAAIAELEAAWSGEVFTPPDRSAEARAIEAELTRQGKFELYILEETPIPIELHAHAEIGKGRTHDRRQWWVETDGARITLILGSKDRRSYELVRCPDAIWRGTRRRPPIAKTSLAPVSDAIPDPAAEHQPGLIDDLLLAAGLDGASSEALGRLADSLALLARVIPGVPARLFHLAATEPDVVRRDRLRALAATVSTSERQVSQVVTRQHVLGTGYQKMDQS